jgi:hypothetical protein
MIRHRVEPCAVLGLLNTGCRSPLCAVRMIREIPYSFLARNLLYY